MCLPGGIQTCLQGIYLKEMTRGVSINLDAHQSDQYNQNSKLKAIYMSKTWGIVCGTWWHFDTRKHYSKVLNNNVEIYLSLQR